MSDNEEMMQTKNSSLEDSSGDESSSEAAVNNQKFSSRDGEPVNKPRKESTSSTGSSSSSEDGDGPREIEDDSEEESSKSEACISKSVSKTEDSVSSAASEQQPQQPGPQPRSRSVSVEEAPPAPASRKMSSKKSSVASRSSIAEDAGNTDDEVEDIREAAPAPVPVVRKVSAPVQPEIVIDEHEDELTKEEIVNSKRETVHLDEAQKAEVIAEVRKSSAASAASVSDSDSESEQAPPPAAREPEVPRKNSSNSVQENASIEAKPATIIEDNSSASSSDNDENIKPSHKFRNESPEQNHENHDLNGRRSTNGIDVTKIYTQGMDNNNKKTINNNNNNVEKMGETRTKPTRDITQIYTQGVAKASPPASPRSMPRGRPASDITKLYTGKLDFAGSKTPDTADKPGPRKHNMSTAVDKDAIRQAYDDVRSDTKETEWAVFKFDQSNRLGVTATGKEFGDFKTHFEADDRGFGYIRIKTGDEMSKRAKFVLVTWVGQNVSVMKKAKMSTDKALLKDIIQNMSVEFQLENHGEFSADHFKLKVDKASGAQYGTGVNEVKA